MNNVRHNQSLTLKDKMVHKKSNAISIEVQQEIEARVNAFNEKHLSKSYSKYYPRIQGKFIYLMVGHSFPPGTAPTDFDKICRLTYSGDLEDMDFAIFKYSSETYDPNENFFTGVENVDGTLEGAMKAGLKAYPV